MHDTDEREADEQAFNETLKRMLATKPTPHEKSDSPPMQRKPRDDKSTSEQRE